MDEVITCGCKSQSWVIGTSGIRCAKCGYWLPSDFAIVDVSSMNASIKEAKDKTKFESD